MKSLTPPGYNARSTFELCAGNVRNKELSLRLLSVIDAIEAAETRYKEQAAKAALFTIAEARTVAGHIEPKEMVRLYKGTLSRKDSPSRLIYDAIMVAPQHGICPLCNQRLVNTLDHYLAQSRHPALAVTPVNLVPACSDCNKAKLDRQPVCATEQTMHPYFDDVGDIIWLVAKLKESTPPAFVFSTNPAVACDEVKRERILTHFRIFKLGPLYSAHAARHLYNIRYSLKTVADREGPTGLRDYLIEEAENHRAAAMNSWESAMYQALAESEWFHTDGYKTIE